VDERTAEGSDFIKVISDAREGGSLTEDTISAIVSASHSRRKQVWVHVLDEGNARKAVMAGADGLAHLFAGDSAGSDFGELLMEHHVSVIPTIIVLLNAMIGGSQIEPMLADDRLKPFINVMALHPFPSRPRPNLHKGMSEAMEQLIAAQVPILAGTDAAPPITGIPWGVSLHRELELLVKEGLTPVQALAASTSATAQAFQLTDRGYVRPGLRADLLLVEGDPTSKIDSTRNIIGVWKAGLQVRRTE
jgi:imidazolonepropionase-like amidohydrolase